jgi:predicted DNA-binding transcriptional regulator YafY
MSINKLALIRYKTIDNCLQNHFRKWTLEDLISACSESLYEYEGITSGVSKRTIQLDIQNMRSEKLGYNAPIEVIDKKYYTYSEKNFSITNTPITKQDVHTLHEVLDILKQFKGFSHFEEVNSIVTRLEDKLYKQQHKGQSYIEFEKNDLLKGLEYLDPLMKVITKKKPICIHYQSFKAKEVSEIHFSPYLLKEYRNRWFVLGKPSKGKNIMNLALDRIQSLTESKLKYEKATFDVNTYYYDTIGVTKMPHQRSQTIVFKIDNNHAPYVLTKPLHTSQQLLKKDEHVHYLSMQVIWNFELEKELLAFGEQITVLSPRRLVKSIFNRLQKATTKYLKER